MVPLNLDFYGYRKEVKHAIIRRLSRLDVNWDPFVASWLAYALSQDGFEDNPLLLKLIEWLRLWAEEIDISKTQRNLGPLCFLAYFLNRLGEVKYTEGIMDQLHQIKERRMLDHKFSPFNDPEQVFPMALLVGSMGGSYKDIKDFLKNVARNRIKGSIKRQALYIAVLRELGELFSLYEPKEEISDSGDIIALIWYWERYDRPAEIEKWWKTFERIKDSLSLLPDETSEGIRILSDPEIALLYESLTREMKNPHPNVLFEFYPLHPRVRDIAWKLFKEGNYLHAVLEAAKAFEEHLKRITGIEQTCRSLVQQSFSVKSPHIKFNGLKTQSEKDEQEGLKLIAEGICAAFRNPKGHEPMDSPQVQIDAIEALDQLVIISYLFRRIDKAKIENP